MIDKDQWRTWIAKIGIVGFLFFLIKGLLWLLVPTMIAMGFFKSC